MRVLVTGGLGFLGHAVVTRLVGLGHHPFAITSRPRATSLVDGASTISVDIRDRGGLADVVRAISPDGVCHLAALTRVRDSFELPLTYFDVNVAGTISLLEALGGRPALPVVFASSGAVYGPCEGVVCEDQPTAPTNPYAASKLAAEELLRCQARTGAVGVTILRCFNIAGAVDGVGDSDTTRIIPKALAVAAGKAGHLTINGDGRAVREFIHVADVASAVVASLQATTAGAAATFNVGSGVGISMLDVVNEAELVTGCAVPVEHAAPKHEPAVLVADSSRIRAELGWRPECSTLDTIIRDAWQAVRS